MNRLLPLLVSVVLVSGCETLQTVSSLTGGKINLAGGGSSDRSFDVGKVTQAAKQLRSGFSDISESEEYYIGRAVAAQILGRYKKLDDAKLDRYAQEVLQTVAAASDRPATYKGYHVQVLDSDEVNAFAAPGGFVFVTKGMMSLAKNEDELGCVLAHEVAHVSKKHGLKTIQTSRLTSAFALLGGEAAKRYSPDQVAKLTQAFEGAIDDVVNKLVLNGYSRDKEYEADKFAAQYARAAGYDPRALEAFLTRMDKASSSHGGVFKTHPAAAKRVSELGSLTASSSYRESAARDRRFSAATQVLR